MQQQQAAHRTEGRRLRALGDAFHRTVKYALRGIDREAFGELFPGMRTNLVDVLYEGYRQASLSARHRPGSTP